jgi:hypothetical protein
VSYRILQGDVVKRLRDLHGRSIDCVVTSPPYWGLRDYGVEGQIGMESTPAEYIAKMVEVFREVRRVLRADGTCWINMGDCYATGAGKVGECPGGGKQGARWAGDLRIRDERREYRGTRLANGRGDSPGVFRVKTRASRDSAHAGKNTAMVAIGPMTQPNRLPLPGLKAKDLVGIPWKLAFALQGDGWWLRQDIIWNKPNPMPESVRDRCTRSHEYIFLLSRSRLYYFDADAIKEPVAGTAHARGKGVGPKAVSGWASGPGSHSTIAHNRGRRKQNASFGAAVVSLVNASPFKVCPYVGAILRDREKEAQANG